MLKNSVFILFIQQLMCGSGFAYRWNNQWEPKHNSSDQSAYQLMTTRLSDYECDQKSYFKSIEISFVSQEQVFCDELTIQETDKRLIAYGFRDGRRVAINLLDTYFAHMDQNGNEIFYRIGKISGGPCDGDLLFVEAYLKPTKGWCDFRFGVTGLRSTRTIFAIRGKCESTCFGHSSVKYTPGKGRKH